MNSNIPVGYSNEGDYIGFNDPRATLPNLSSKEEEVIETDELAYLEEEVADAQQVFDNDSLELSNAIKNAEKSHDELERLKSKLAEYKDNLN